MKRVLSFDFLRGIAIIGVLLFHVLNIAFEQRKEEIEAAVISGTGTVEIYWYILGPVLLVLGSFNGMFLMVSAASNSISVHKQWEKLTVEKGVDKNKAFKSIFVSQVIRGAMICAFGYLSETVLATLLDAYVKMLRLQPLDSSSPWWWLKGLYMTNILTTIGISIIVTSFIQLLYLKNGISREKMSLFLIIVVILCTALMPLTQYFAEGLFGTDTLSDGIGDLSIPAWQYIPRFLLAPVIGRLTPLIPFFSCAAVGLLFSININENAIKPSTLRKFLYGGLLFVCASFIVGLALNDIDIGSRERVVFYQMFILGLEIVSTTYLLYMIDFRRKTNFELFTRCTRWTRRFGITTLTLWILQYFMVFPVVLVQLITGWPIIQGGLVDWQLGVLLLLLFFMWHGILCAWEKGRFIGSFEWVTTIALSKKSSSGDRMQMDGILYKPEKMIQHVTETERKVDGAERTLIITNLAFAGFYALVIALVAAGVLAL
ncbi:MAG: hypothetical protein JW839_18295 [Candidatus Lokiarchaeota archaeon]|nr:hypothetical protein [Candidatus Lokiarchaeota archaeon]